MTKMSFQLKSARFTMDDGLVQKIDFLGPTAIARKTHITLIAGANGTSKSRFLASIVDRFCELNDEASDKKASKRYGSSGNHGLNCEQLDTRGQIPDNEKKFHGPTLLPSKILVLSNLVMDRFRFVQNDPDEDQFYQYLGVRQATNLMTTGSMQRSVSEAVMALYQDEGKRKLFQNWIRLVFGDTREIALTFDRTSRSQLEKYLSAPEPEEAIIERMVRSRGSGRLEGERFLQSSKESAPAVIRLIKFLLIRSEDSELVGLKKSGRKNLILRLDTLPNEALSELADLSFAFGAALKTHLFSWPNVSIEGSAWSGWTDFGQLSSGEQNILSTGAKLIAHAEPGCLIAIDEPEISLNTSWQQHYTDLVSHSLAQAQGSHVLIATHSPHLIASLPAGEASVVLVEKNRDQLKTSTVDAEFEGWGAESILYQVLDIPSASNFKFQRELASILLHIQNRGHDKKLLDNFLGKADRLNFEGIDALAAVVNSIKQYRDSLE
jgi:predicted ATPase